MASTGSRDDVDVDEYQIESNPPTCCLVFPITYGTVCLSAITLALSALPVTFGTMLLKNPDYYASVLPELKYNEHMVTMYAGSLLGFGLILSLFSVLSIVGVAKRKPGFLVPLLLMGVFSCVLSFFVVLDSLNPTVTSELYRHYHTRGNVFCFSLLLFLLKLYFTLTLYQCYNTLAGNRRSHSVTAVPAMEPLPMKVHPSFPVMRPMKDMPPAYA